MPQHDERYQQIATAARARVKSQEARKSRRRVAKAYREDDPLKAEPDPNRRVLRMQAVTGLDADAARRVVEGETPPEQLSGDERYGAERLLGATVDYLPVS